MDIPEPGRFLAEYDRKRIDVENGVKIIHAVSLLDYRAWTRALRGEDVDHLFADASQAGLPVGIAIEAGCLDGLVSGYRSCGKVRRCGIGNHNVIRDTAGITGSIGGRTANIAGAYTKLAALVAATHNYRTVCNICRTQCGQVNLRAEAAIGIGGN